MRRLLSALCLVAIAACGDDVTSRPDGAADTTPPDTAITSGPPATTGETTADISFVGEPADDAASFECSLDNGTFAQCTSPSTVSVASGPHTFRVRAIDAAGNADPTPASHSWTVDASAPVVSITGPEGLTNVATISWSFTAPGAVSTECALDGGAPAACTSPYVAGALAEGPHTIVVRAVDAAGNAGEASRMVTIDRSPPTITITDGPSGPINDPTPTWTFTTAGDPTTVECRVDAAQFAACTGTFTAPTLGAGGHTFEVRARDAAGNSGRATRAVTLDLLPPTVDIVGGPTGVTSTQTPTFMFVTTGAPAAIECRIDAGAFGACTSPSTFTAPALASGAHTFDVRVRDEAGNTDADMRAFSVDIDPPAVSITSGPAGTVASPAVLFTFTTSGDPTVVQCRFDAAVFTSCTVGMFTDVLQDGEHTFEVQVADAAGNTSSATRTFTIDTIAPTVTVTSGPSGTTADTTPTFGFTVTGAPSTTECRVDAGAFADCTSPFTTSSLGAGDHSFEVRVTDAAGNTGSDTRTFAVDTTAPPVSITLAPPSPTNDPTATFEFTTVGATTVTCAFDAATPTPCTSPITSAALPEGTHTFIVEGCGTTGACANDSRTFIVDTTAPVIAITAGPAEGAFITDSSPTFTFTVDGTPVTVACRLVTAATPDPVFAPCTSPVTTQTLTNGGHRLEIRATDEAGNTATLGRNFSVDTSAVALTITGGPNGPDDLDPVVPFTFTAEADAAVVECRIDARPAEDCLGGTYAWPADLADGTNEGPHTFTVSARDGAGNTSSASQSFIVDTIDPVVSITGPVTPPATNDNTPSFAITAPATGTTPIALRCRFDGSGVFSACTSSFTASTLLDGPHTLEVEAEDPAGNIGTGSFAFSIDTQPPSITVNAPLIPDRTSNRRPTLSFAVSGAPATIGCAVDQTSTFTACTNTLTVAADLSEAEHHYYVRAVDASGNAVMIDEAFTVDATPPSILVDAAVNPTDDPTPTFTFTASADAASITCALDGGAPFACRSPVTIAGPVAPGSHTFTVTVGDTATPANTASDSTTYLMTQCGDGEIAGREDCETANLNGASCTSLGYGAGTLACSAQCTFDAAACGGGYIAANAGINIGTRICRGDGGVRYSPIAVSPLGLAACTESDGPLSGAITAATGATTWSPWNLLNSLIRTTTTGSAGASIDVTTFVEHTYEVGSPVTFTNAGVLTGARTVTAVVSQTTFRVMTPSAVAAPITTGTVNSTVNPRGRAILYGFDNNAQYMAAGTFGRGNFFQSANTTTFNTTINAGLSGGQALAFDFHAFTKRAPVGLVLGSWSVTGPAASHGSLTNNFQPRTQLITIPLTDPANVQTCTIDNDCPLVCADGNCPPGVTASTRRKCFVQSAVHTGAPVANNTWCETGGPDPESAATTVDCVGRCQVTGTPTSFAYGNKPPPPNLTAAGDTLVAIYGRTPPAGDDVNGVPAIGGIWRACDLVQANNANSAGTCPPGAPEYPCPNGVAKGSWNRRDNMISRTLPVQSATAGTCGDGTCNSSETRQSCPQDCEADINLVYSVVADQTTNSAALTCGEAPNPVTSVRGVTRYLAALRGGSRVLRTEDNGVTWTQSGSGIPAGTEVYQIAADCFFNTDVPGSASACRNDDLKPDNNVFYAATSRGVYRSTDSGTTWTLDGLKGKEVRSVAIEPIQGRQITANSIPTSGSTVVLSIFGRWPYVAGNMVTVSGMSLGDSTVLNGEWPVTNVGTTPVGGVFTLTIDIGSTPRPTTSDNSGNGYVTITRQSRVYVGVDDGTKIYRRP